MNNRQSHYPCLDTLMWNTNHTV